MDIIRTITVFIYLLVMIVRIQARKSSPSILGCSFHPLLLTSSSSIFVETFFHSQAQLSFTHVLGSRPSSVQTMTLYIHMIHNLFESHTICLLQPLVTRVVIYCSCEASIRGAYFALFCPRMLGGKRGR